MEQEAQLVQWITSYGSFVSRDRIEAVMPMASRRPIHTICQVDQFVRYRNLNRLWLHIRLDEDQVAMAGCMQL